MVVAFSISLITIPVAASENISVMLNGEELAFDVPPQLVEDRTMVPMRRIFEALGAVVNWFDDEEEIAAELVEIIRENEMFGIPNAEIFDWVAYRPVIQAFDNYGGVLLQVGSRAMLAMGTSILDLRWVELDAAPQVIGERTLVPVRAIAEGLNADVDWDGDTQTVIITREEAEVVAGVTVLDDGRKSIRFETAEVNIRLPEDWEVVQSAGSPLPGAVRTYDFTIIPLDGVSVGIVTIGSRIGGRALTQEEFYVWQSVLENSILPRSVEETATYTPLLLNNGVGVFSGVYTYADLVGTTPPPDQYLYLGVFLGNWNHGVIAHATLLTNEVDGFSFNLMQLALALMEVSFD